MKIDELLGSLLGRFTRELKQEYKTSQEEAAENLYAAFAQVIADTKPDVQTAFFVLKVLESRLMFDTQLKLFGAGEEIKLRGKTIVVVAPDKPGKA